MKKRSVDSSVLDYLFGRIPPQEEKAVRRRLGREGHDLEELDLTRRLTSDMGRIPVPEPSDRMTDNFYRQLEEQKTLPAGESVPHKSILRSILASFVKRPAGPAFTFAVLFIGWMIGYWFTPGRAPSSQIQYLSSELLQVKKMMTFSLLNQPAPTERIRAILKLRTLGEADEAVVGALLETLNQDPNVNVRLVALETLSDLGDSPELNTSLILALYHQTSPLLQLRLAEAVTSMRGIDPQKTLRRFLENKELNETVRDRITRKLEALT